MGIRDGEKEVKEEKKEEEEECGFVCAETFYNLIVFFKELQLRAYSLCKVVERACHQRMC